MRMANKRLKKTGRQEGVMKVIYSRKQSRGMVAKLRNRTKWVPCDHSIACTNAAEWAVMGGQRWTTFPVGVRMRTQQSWSWIKISTLGNFVHNFGLLVAEAR